MSVLLNPSKRVNHIDNIIFVDTESELDKVEDKRTQHKCYLICFKHYRREKNTYKNKKYCNYAMTYEGANTIVNKFWLYIDKALQKEKKLYICAHNAKYDSLILQTLPRLEKFHYTLENFSFANPFFITFKNEKGNKCTFFSSTNIFQTSIKKLGKMLNMDKIEYDYYSNGINWGKAITYCRRDVDILYYTYLHYFEMLKNIGDMSDKITVASQALECYKRFFQPEENPIEIHKIKELHKKERFGYKGGRCECYRIGKFKNVYSFDINSMYPYVMRNIKLPYKLKFTRPTMTVNELQKYIDNDNYYIYANCYIKTNRRCFAKIYNKRLCFPVGEYWEYLHHSEIKNALEHGEILRVFDVCVYEKGILFDNYVDFFYNKRQKAKSEGNEIYTYLYKIMMNSLYGKFGQKQITTEKEETGNNETIGAMIEITYDKENNRIIKEWQYINGYRYHSYTSGESYNAFPIIAGAITATARMLLYSFIECAGEKNVYYMDTDSIFTNEEGKKALEKANMLDEKELGKMKLEKFCETLIIRNCKDYTYTEKNKEHIKRKGINVYSNQTREIKKDLYAVEYWSGYHDFLKNKNNFYYTETREKKYSEIYNKGIVDKGYTHPFVIKEEKNFFPKEYKY